MFPLLLWLYHSCYPVLCWDHHSSLAQEFAAVRDVLLMLTNSSTRRRPTSHNHSTKCYKAALCHWLQHGSRCYQSGAAQARNEVSMACSCCCPHTLTRRSADLQPGVVGMQASLMACCPLRGWGTALKAALQALPASWQTTFSPRSVSRMQLACLHLLQNRKHDNVTKLPWLCFAVQ